MDGKYDIDKSLGIYAGFTPPLGRGVLRLAHVALKAAPKGLRGGVTAQKLRIPSGGREMSATLLRPKGAVGALPCLVYFHGGGFVFAAAPYHYANAKYYAVGADCAVLMPEYSLSPKRPFPAPLDDGDAAYSYAAHRAEELDILPGAIAVGGDSAGGYIAASVTERAAAAGRPPLGAMLIYPVTGERGTESMKRYTDTPMWNAVLNAKMWKLCAHGEPLPVLGSVPHGMPQSYVETAEFDCLRDEGAHLAERLAAAGVTVTRNDTRRTIHGYDIARRSPLTSAALIARTKWLKRLFTGQSQEK